MPIKEDQGKPEVPEGAVGEKNLELQPANKAPDSKTRETLRVIFAIFYLFKKQNIP